MLHLLRAAIVPGGMLCVLFLMAFVVGSTVENLRIRGWYRIFIVIVILPILAFFVAAFAYVARFMQ